MNPARWARIKEVFNAALDLAEPERARDVDPAAVRQIHVDQHQIERHAALDQLYRVRDPVDGRDHGETLLAQ